MTTPTNNSPFDWAEGPYGWDGDAPRPSRSGQNLPPQQQGPTPWQGQAQAQQGPTRHTHKERTHNVNVGFTGGNGGRGGGTGGGRVSAESGSSDRHQGDRLIHAIERIEIASDKDVLALAKAINHLGRELHLILGMRADELQGVLSQYQGKWYTFGAASRVKSRLVAAHLKVSAEAAKALGVGALKMAHSFDRHFVKPEREARQKAKGKTGRKTFSIGDE